MNSYNHKNASDIITKYFNHEFNEFIAKGKSSVHIGALISGGSYDFDEDAYHIFNRLASDLERFRTNFNNEYISVDYIEKDEIKKALGPLIVICEDGAAYKKLNKINRDYLNEHFIEAAKKFFKDIDKLYKTDYFSKYILSH